MMGLVQRGQVHFEQNGQTYLLVGTLFTAAYTVHSKWGTVAVLCFTVTAVGSYSYLRKQVNFLLNRNLDAKVPALLSVVISVVTIFFPALGVCLGSLMGASSLLRDWSFSSLLEEGEEEIKTLKNQNKELEKTAEEMKKKVDALQIEFDKAIALVGKVEKITLQHLETQGIVAETDAKVDNQFDRLEAKLQQFFSLGDLEKELSKVEMDKDVGANIRQMVATCHQQQQQEQTVINDLGRVTAALHNRLDQLEQLEDEESARVQKILDQSRGSALGINK